MVATGVERGISGFICRLEGLMTFDEINDAVAKFLSGGGFVANIFLLCCWALTYCVAYSGDARRGADVSVTQQMCIFFCVSFSLQLALVIICYICENLYEIGGSFCQTIADYISSFYSYIGEFFGIIYHHTDPVVGSIISHFIVGLCILLLLVFMCFMLQKLNPNLRPKYTVPIISFNVAVALKNDGITQNNYGIPICIMISALWIVLVKYSMEVETTAQGRGYQSIGAVMTNNNRLEEGRALQNTRSDYRATTNSSLLGEARNQRVYDAITVGALTRIHTVGGHDHTLFVSDECPICMESFGETTRALSCGHCFHDKCIQEWFINRSSHPCPVCKQPSTVAGWLVKSLFQ